MSETESPVYCSNQCISAFLKVLPNVWKDKSHAKIWPNFCADHSRSYRAGNWNICRTFTHSPSEATSQNINKTRKMFIIVRNERLTRQAAVLPYVVIASQCSCILAPFAPVFSSAPPLSLHIQLFYRSRTAPPLTKHDNSLLFFFSILLSLVFLYGALEFQIIHLDTGFHKSVHFQERLTKLPRKILLWQHITCSNTPLFMLL